MDGDGALVQALALSQALTLTLEWTFALALVHMAFNSFINIHCKMTMVMLVVMVIKHGALALAQALASSLALDHADD